MKKIFIGIDFSKETFDVSFFEKERKKTAGYSRFDNTREGYSQQFKRLKLQTSVPAEAWLFCGEHTGLYSAGRGIPAGKRIVYPA